MVPNYYVDLRQIPCALKLKTIKDHGKKIKKIQYIVEVEKEQKLESIEDAEEYTALNKTDDDPLVRLVSHSHNTFQSSDSNFEVYIKK